MKTQENKEGGCLPATIKEKKRNDIGKVLISRHFLVEH